MNQDNAAARVLIVDDEPLNLDLLSQQLGRHGYDVSTAASAREAMAMIDRREPDVVILDIMMPDISGLELLHQLRESSATETLPVILVSGLGDSDDIVRGLEAGADDYVTKPIDMPVLLARLETQLKGSARLRTSERQAELLARLAEIDAALVRNLSEAAGLADVAADDDVAQSTSNAFSRRFDQRATAEYDAVEDVNQRTTEDYFAYDDYSDTGEFQAVDHSLFEVLESQVARSLRDDRPLSVLVMEPDQARTLRNEHGLELGVELVGKFVQRVAAALDSSAALYRYQSTVFCAVLGGFDADSAAQVAGRIFDKVSRRAFETELGAFRMTVSIGVAALSPALGSSPVELVERAFSALDHARNSDRSPIWVARGEGILTPC